MQILFLGPPGAGKGTQCQRLSAHLHLLHLSSGDLLREAVANGTAAGQEAKSFMDAGKLVPDPVLIAMFKDKLQGVDCQKGFILDGFPRNVAQAKALDDLLTEIKKDLQVVINLTVDEKLLTERIAGRRTCSKKGCNRAFHIKFAPPKTENVCDNCGAALTQRSDDKAELVEARLKTYHEQTTPLIDYYSKKGLLKAVDGDGSQDAIFNQLLKTLQVVTA